MVHYLLNLARQLPSGDFFLALPFWGFFALAAAMYRLVPGLSRLKPWLLLATSAGMLLTLPQFNLTMLATLAGVCLFTYAIAAYLNGARARSPRVRWWTATGGIAGIISVLAFSKYSFLQAFLRSRFEQMGWTGSDFVFLIGISYSSFKAMHFIIEGYRKSLKAPDMVGLMNYVLFFPAFISGPINRYNQFIENSDIARGAGLGEDLKAGLPRIVHGLFKKIVLVTLVAPYTIKNMGVPVAQMSLWEVLIGFYALALYFYFDFSGYTDLAIGTGRIMGFVLPENFNFPFFKKNIQQFWANWHMSLTSWLTDYVYWPLVRKLRTGEFFKKHPVMLSNAAIILTFALCGIWHGSTLNFAIWGVYQGIGIASVNTYQSWKRKVRNPVARKYFASSLSRALGLVASFNFFAIGQSMFVLNGEQIKSLFGRFL